MYYLSHIVPNIQFITLQFVFKPIRHLSQLNTYVNTNQSPNSATNVDICTVDKLQERLYNFTDLLRGEVQSMRSVEETIPFLMRNADNIHQLINMYIEVLWNK